MMTENTVVGTEDVIGGDDGRDEDGKRNKMVLS